MIEHLQHHHVLSMKLGHAYRMVAVVADASVAAFVVVCATKLMTTVFFQYRQHQKDLRTRIHFSQNSPAKKTLYLEFGLSDNKATTSNQLFSFIRIHFILYIYIFFLLYFVLLLVFLFHTHIHSVSFIVFSSMPFVRFPHTHILKNVHWKIRINSYNCVLWFLSKLLDLCMQFSMRSKIRSFLFRSILNDISYSDTISFFMN